VGTSVLKEAFTLKTSKDFDRIILEISWEGVTPVSEEDGSIVFFDGNEKVVKILPPFMEDAGNTVCTDIHYELVETETGYELHKVIDAKGLQWLKEAVYPVVIDPSMQVFEDAWESSGLQPYGQYFQNLKEYVNPANGHLTVTQTDLVIPGRGLDVVISRTYETPAVFYQAEPHEYVQPPVNVGKGWHLNFPWVGSEYLYLQNGTVYKIEWTGDTFENHEGAHFVLVKNLDDTYILTMANGTVYEFSIAGKLTEIQDLDQNTITFNYSSGILTSITDTIGRTVTFTYSDDRLQKIVYNSAEIEYGYSNGCLVWMDDFLNRKTSYTYNTGWFEWIETSPGCIQKGNVYLLSEIEYPTGGYTTYAYDRFSYEAVYGDDGSCLDYFKYYVTHQKVYETDQVRHSAFAYTGTFSGITSCVTTVKNESDVTKGSYHFNINTSTELIYQQVTKNASGEPIRKYIYTHNSKKECIQADVYNDGSNLSYTNYYAYDNWGNCIYSKNAEGHEQFFSYANTDTSGFFIENTGTVIRQFTNAFANSSVPESVHTALLGTAERQDNTYVKETYLTYDLNAHPIQSTNAFGNATTWLTFSGTFNEKTGVTSFPVDLTEHTVTGNAVLQVTGLPSDDTYQENHLYNCPCNPTIKCTWTGGSWPNNYYRVHWSWCAGFPYPECDDGWASVGPFTHYPGTLGYQSYSTNPPMGGKAHTITVTTNWKAYPAQVQYTIDGSLWETVTSNLQNQTVQIPVSITGGSHTLNFSESSAKQTTFSWYLYVPVDNTPDTYTTTMQYDIYGNVTSITDAESNTIFLTYSSTYSYAYLTEISATVGTETVTTKATYNPARGWITSIQEPKGVDAGSGYDYLFSYDLLGRIVKREFPLLSGQSQRSYLEAVYDDTNRTVTIIDQLRHYITRHYDKLGRLTDVEAYTGTYGSGTLYATESYTYQYNNLISTVTDPGTDTYTYTYDFLGRKTQVHYPDSSTVTCSYDDTNNKVTLTNGRNYNRIYWYDWLSRLEKVEEEYTTDTYAVTTYQYDDVGHLTSFTDAETHTTTHTYASLFGLTRTTYPVTEYEEYTYDNVGNATTFTDCKGNDTTYTYDDIYRLTQIQYQDQSTVDFAYDLNSNRTKMDDDTPNANDYVEYTYDYWNRLTSETRHITTSTYTVSYQYDVATRLTKLTYPDSMQILYSYDDLNRTTEIKRYVDGLNDEVLLDQVQYDVDNLITQFDYGNDLQAAFSYDTRDRIATIDVKNGTTSYLDLDYTLDDNNNITQLVNGWRDTSSTWHSETESYSYDGLDRLTSASCTSWSHTYAYDKVGNRTSKDSVTYTINTVNEVTSLSDGTSFTYDDHGNRTQKTKGTDIWVYNYDYANRLTKVEKNSSVLEEYVYDGDGKRTQVTENSVTDTCIYFGVSVLYEENMNGIAVYIYGPRGRVARRTTIQSESHTFYYIIDHLGSTRLVTDESRNTVADAAYHPFGESTVAGEESYLYTGKESDFCGLYYYGARYYDPEIGRFISRDPIKGRLLNPESLNRYIYCLNNPLKYMDPTGLVTMSNVETGVSITLTKNGWIAKGEDGATITKTEIDSLIEQGTHLGAMAKILSVFGYCMEDASIIYYSENPEEKPESPYGKFEGHIKFMADGREVTLFLDLTNNIESSGHTFQLGINGPLEVHMILSKKMTLTAERLFLLVGHEMQHVEQLVSGKYMQWEWTYGPEGAKAYSEMEATKWNIHICLSSLPFCDYLSEHKQYLNYWTGLFENRPLGGR
jgi:RHS repeat-associated protein